LIGDFTGMIGDPTDKSKTRRQLTREQVLNNSKNYKKEASKILKFTGDNPVEIMYNSEWLAKLNFKEIIELSAHFTVQQMLERDMFQDRIKNELPIGLHEFLYPLMQGYDSVAMGVDGEIGGNDQMFNMLAGRTLMKNILNKEKFVLTMKLLEDTTGKKMGKTEGNMIRLTDPPEEMFGKVMAWTDGMIYRGFELCTDSNMKEIEELCIKMNRGNINPRDLKLRLAREIVNQFYSTEEAKAAEEHFIKVFAKKEKPEDIPEMKIKNNNIVDVLVETKLAKSKSEARRLIDQKGIKINDIVIEDPNLILEPIEEGIIIQKGKRFFVKVFL